MRSKAVVSNDPTQKHRWRKWLYLVLAMLLIGGWLLFRTPPSSATIGYAYGSIPSLCVRPGQLICLRFSKPLTTGIKEFYEQFTSQSSKDSLVFVDWVRPEIAASAMYWRDVLYISRFEEAWLVSEREVMLRVAQERAINGGPFELKYPSPKKTKGGERFKFSVWVWTGDPLKDQTVDLQQRLPPDGKIPFVEGNVEVYYVEPSLWMRFRFWLHQELMRRGIDIGL